MQHQLLRTPISRHTKSRPSFTLPKGDPCVPWVVGLGGLILSLTGWQFLVWLGDYPTFLLPAPSDVAHKGLLLLHNGQLWRHTQVTLVETVLGFALGYTLATVLGYGFAKCPLLEQLISPSIVAIQAIPIVALAPLVVLWFGFGLLSKVLICALIVFFPVLVSTMAGIRSVDAEWHELMRALGATPWQSFKYVEVPGALPILFSGLKSGATLAVVGAVVGEFIGAQYGLGALINISRSLFDTAQLFVALFTLAGMALCFYGLMVFLERRLVTWQR